MRSLLFISLVAGLFLLPVSLFAQAGPLFRLKLNIGPQVRSHTHFNRSGNFGAQYPISYPPRTGGFGLTTGFELQATRLKLSLEYAPAFRYAFLYPRPNVYPHEEVNAFITDHTLSLFQYLNARDLFRSEWKMYLGLNYTLYNAGKKLPYTEPNTGIPRKYDLSYHAWGALIGVTFGRFGLDFKGQFIPRNVYPYEARDRRHWLYGGRVYYSIRLGQR